MGVGHHVSEAEQDATGTDIGLRLLDGRTRRSQQIRLPSPCGWSQRREHRPLLRVYLKKQLANEDLNTVRGNEAPAQPPARLLPCPPRRSQKPAPSVSSHEDHRGGERSVSALWLASSPCLVHRWAFPGEARPAAERRHVCAGRAVGGGGRGGGRSRGGTGQGRRAGNSHLRNEIIFSSVPLNDSSRLKRGESE